VTDLRPYWYGVCQQVARVLFTLFFRIRVFHRERLPARGGVLVVSNHQSYLDPVLVAVGMPRPFHPMARETLFKFLPFALVIRSLYAFPVRRKSADLGAVREAMRRLKGGAVVLMFPEGTRTRNGSIAPLQAGPVTIAGRAGVPVVPAVIEGAFEAWPRTCWLPRPHPVRVAFGQPLSAEEVAAGDPETLVKVLWQRMQALQAELRRRSRCNDAI
jgi:1-acyl-sn-glycerol-3-phosphate acyltransferase